MFMHDLNRKYMVKFARFPFDQRTPLEQPLGVGLTWIRVSLSFSTSTVFFFSANWFSPGQVTSSRLAAEDFPLPSRSCYLLHPVLFTPSFSQNLGLVSLLLSVFSGFVVLVLISKMGSPSRELPEFFKVYLPEYSTERLLIPLAFLKHFNGRVPKKAILRDLNGRVWRVQVGQMEEKVYFLNGWQQFLADNSVEEGNFLVFRYDGNHAFDFKLFGTTGCEKRALNKSVGFCVKEEQDVEEDEREEEEEEGSEEEVEKEEEEGFWDREGEERDGDSDDDDEEHEEDEDGQGEDEDEKEEEEDWTEEEEESSYEDQRRKMMIKHESSGSGRGRPSKGCHKSSRIKRTNPSHSLALEKSFCMTSVSESGNPYFKTILREAKHRRLHIPSVVLKDHNIKLPCKIVLRDPLGRTWTGDVRVWRDHRAWAGGWRALCKWNNVKENDICICELVLDEGKQVNIINVHIINQA